MNPRHYSVATILLNLLFLVHTQIYIKFYGSFLRFSLTFYSNDLLGLGELEVIYDNMDEETQKWMLDNMFL